MPAYFRPSYADHRSQLLALAEARGARLERHPISACGPAGLPLSVDTAWLGSTDPRRVLLVLSGVHGVEGYAGSAIQAQLLGEDLDGLRLPADGALLLVHAVNPFGFAWSRRVNESNVDLNRNFVDHEANEIRRVDYMRYDDLINPSEMPEDDEQRFMARAAELIDLVGFERARAIASEGQYEQPRGLAYGGAKAEESTQILRALVRRLAWAAEVHLIDIHTGLGESGRYTILSDHELETREHARLLEVYPQGRVECPSAGGSISAALSGESGVGMAAELPEAFFWGGAAELGTTDPLAVFRALRRENWCWHHAAREGETHQRYARELLDAFRPDSAQWRADVLAAGRECLRLGWRGLFER